MGDVRERSADNVPHLLEAATESTQKPGAHAFVELGNRSQFGAAMVRVTPKESRQVGYR